MNQEIHITSHISQEAANLLIVKASIHGKGERGIGDLEDSSWNLFRLLCATCRVPCHGIDHIKPVISDDQTYLQYQAQERVSGTFASTPQLPCSDKTLQIKQQS